jgi:hypothetical protein
MLLLSKGRLIGRIHNQPAVANKHLASRQSVEVFLQKSHGGVSPSGRI